MRGLVPILRNNLKIRLKQKLPRTYLEYGNFFTKKPSLLRLKSLRDKSNVPSTSRFPKIDFIRIKSWRKQDMNQQYWILLTVVVIGISGILLYCLHRKRIKHVKGNPSKSSSRPGSGSRRRRRPNGRGLALTVTEHTTDEYASSESDSLYSDDSLTECNHRSGGQIAHGNSDVGNGTVDNSRVADLESSEIEPSDMLSSHSKKMHRRRQSPRQENQNNGADVSNDGTRTVGIQTLGRSDRVHSGGSTRTDTSEELNISFASGDYSSLGRNMGVSPLSLWANDRQDSDSFSDKNSTYSAGVKVHLNDMDRSMTPTPRSSARSSCSFFSDKSNLDKGPTEVWSSSASDLRPLRGFREDLMFKMETEGTYPGQAPLDSEDTQSQRSLNVRTPVDEEGLTPRLECSTPINAAKVVHVTFPEGQSVKSEAFSANVPVKYQVTIHEDSTNIMYNVDKTEYKTYSLRKQSDIQPFVIPDTIHVNLTESVTSETHDKFESNSKEDISFHKPDDKHEPEEDSLILERSFRSSCSSERELLAESGAIPQETFKELTEKTEQQSCFQVPSTKFDYSKRKKPLELHQTGIIANSVYPGTDESVVGDDGECQVQSDGGNVLNESDTTSDYGTFTSVDGRKGLVSFTSDSEEGDSGTMSPSVSPKASHKSSDKIHTDRVSPWFHDRLKQLPEQGRVLEASEENIQTLSVQGQSLCSIQDMINPSVIAARLQQSSPTQLVCNQTHTLDQEEIDYNENSIDNTLTRANMPRNSHLVETDINLPIMVNRNEEIDNDSGSMNTLERKDSNENESKMSSRETLESVETIQYDSDNNTTKLDNQIYKHSNQQAEHNDRSVSSQPPVFSPKLLRELTSPLSSADDVYLSLEKLETSTSSSDYHTPQQSPRNYSEAVVSRLVTDVEIPDISSNVSSASPTPREGLTNDQNHGSPNSTDMRTVSVNTEAVSLVSHSPAITQQTFFDENDPAYTEKMRKELEKKIATLKHKERSLSDSAISSDYTDCDSSPRGSRFYDVDNQISGGPFRYSTMHGNHQAIYHTVQSPNHESKKVNFDALSVKKSLFTDSGNVYDHDDEEKVMKGATEQNKEKKKEVKMSNNDQSKDNQKGQHALSTYATERKLCYIPTADAVEMFPERLADAILAIKPHPYPRSVSLDGLSALVNIDTHLSRAVRNRPMKEQGSKESQMSSSQNQKVTHDALKGKGRPSSSDYELKVNKSADKLRGKSTSLSELDPIPTKKVHKSFSEANIDDFEENDTSSSSSDSITFVFVNKNDQDIEGVMNLENPDICLQDANGYDQEHTQDYLYQNSYDPYSEYSASESQSPDSRPISGMAHSGTESEDYSLSESQSPDSRPISGLAPSGTGSDDYSYEANSGGKIIYLDGFPGGLQSEEVLGRTNSRPSTSCEVDILDQSSTHSGSEEIEEIVNINGDRSQMGGSREISVRQNTVSPPAYTDPSDDQTNSDGLDQNVTNSLSADEKPLRHKFGIDESVLPIPERAVSADNLPKHRIKFKDIQRSRSADMLEVGDSNEQESEEGIFPPAIHNVDDDPTDPSISLRTMSDGGLDHVSQRTVSELGVTYSSRTSSELDSVTSTSESSVAKLKAHVDADSSSESSELEEEYQEEIIIEYGKAYETEKLPGYNYGEVPVYNTSRKSPSTASEGEVDPATFQDDEHIREVLRTVEKFIMPKQVLVDHGTSMTDESCLKYVSVGVQTSSMESSTQTNETSPIHVNPDQILLPALAAPFRSQSMDSFGLGVNEPRLVLSEGSNNWCTLGELMIETTNLLRRINERLPDIENRNALPSSEESQAILQKWQEISVQTGYSLADLTTVGLQTDESLTGLGKLLSGSGINAESIAESTQVDTGFKMEPLDVSETITSELIPGPAETISCEISIQTDPGTSDISVLETVEMSIKSNENSDAEKNNEAMERSEAMQDQDAVQYKRETKVIVPSDVRTGSESDKSNVPSDVRTSSESDKSNVDKLKNQEESKSSQIAFSSATKSDTKDSIVPANSTTQQHVFETPIYRSRQMSTPLKQKITLSNESAQSVESDSGNHDAKLPPSNSLLSANSTEIEELRKEHAKLIENLRNASASRKERQNKVKARKHDTTDLITNEPLHAIESSVIKESLPESFRKEQQTYKINEFKERSVKEDSKPSKSKSVSPQEFIKVNIQMDPSTGITVDNTTYRSNVAGTLVEKEKEKGTVHEQTWQLAGDQIMIVSEEKTDLSSDRSRTESDTSVSSGGTTESEIISVMAGHNNMADPAEYAAVRAGALNPVFKNETDIIGGVLGDDVLNSESAENLCLNPVTEKMTKRLVLKPEIFYGDFAEKYTDSEKLDILQAGEIKKPENVNIKSENKEKVFSEVIPGEERIVPKHYRRDNALPTEFPGKPNYSRGSKDKSSSEVSVHEPSMDLTEKNIIKQQDIVKSETSPKLKSSALHSIRIDRSDPGSSVSSTIKYGPAYSHATTLSASVPVAQPLVTSSALSPDRHSAAPRFGHSDDSTQISMEFSDDFTQTDPDTSAETIIHVETRNDKLDRKDDITGKIIPATAHSVSSTHARARPEVSNSMTRELERLQSERGDIMELLSLSYLPTSLTVELLEAKLNYCIGQTDLLLGSLDDNFRPDKSKGTVIDQQFAKEYITKYRADLKRSKQDILMCRERLQKGRVIGSGRGRSVLRNRDLFHDRRLAQIEAFKLERLREQQDYQRSRCSTPIKGNTPLRGNTPLKGNSPIATPRSNISRDSSPDYSPAYMTPKEHKLHYGDLRKQLIRNVLDEERQHTRSCSPTLLGHHPDNKNLDASFGFSPKISVSVSNGMDREDVSTYVVAPGTYADSPRTNSVDRYPHLTASYYQYPHHHVPSHHGLDTRTTAESIFSPQESEQILREIREIQDRTQMSAPIEETIRTSSFSSSTHSHRSLSSSRGGLSPRGQLDMLGPRNRSLSPAARHSDTSLGLNLNYLHDSRHSDLEDTRPYSPYSAYAREHIIPSERLQDDGVLRGSFELYESMSHDRSHDRSHDGSHDTLSMVSQESELHRDSPARSSLNEQRISRLRPIRSADIKARLSRHKR